jgi:peptidoglycan hydrolase CwlO-like protein
MGEDNRLVELVTDLLLEVRDIKTDIRDLKTDVRDIRSELKGFREDTNTRLDRLEDQQVKTNLSIGELRLSVMKISEELKAMVDLDKRLRVVESIVLKAS